MLQDPFLNYIALGLLIFVILILFYGIIIAIHDVPYVIAKKRNHLTRTRFTPSGVNQRPN